MEPILCSREYHATSGEGIFLLGDVRELLPEITQQYNARVQLIYLDPPYRTGDKFSFRTSGGQHVMPAYSDRLSHDDYIFLMREVLTGCRELLSPDGSLYLHVDYRMSAHMRLLLDEIFGAGNFMNEIIWAYKSGGRSMRHYSRKHDSILFYRKSKDVYFCLDAVSEKRGATRRNHMKRFIDESGRVCYSIRSGGKLYVYHENMPVYPSDVWTDIEHLHQRDPERAGYDTQKPEALLRRIILASSCEGALVADLFSGSGTTAAVAKKTGRKFLALDSSPFALYALRRRLTIGDGDLAGGIAPLELRFPISSPGPAVAAEIVYRDGACVCTVSEPGNLIYCALGTIEDGAFVPSVCRYSPDVPFTLHMPRGKTPVLHITDVYGKQGFFAPISVRKP